MARATEVKESCMEIKTNFGKERQHDKDQPGPEDFGVWLKRSVGSSPR